MFAVIDTNNATHIAIHIPHEGADKSLPALARMLEQNAVFVRNGYREFVVAQPKMNIVLGDTYMVEGFDEALAIATVDSVLGDDFVNATPDVLVSNLKARTKAEAEISSLRTELSFTKNELARLKERLAEMSGEQEAA